MYRSGNHDGDRSEKLIYDRNLSLAEGAIQAPGWNKALDGTVAQMYYQALAEHYGFSINTPIKDLDKKHLDLVFYGTGGEKIKVRYKRRDSSGSFMAAFEGIIPNLERKYRETHSQKSKEELEELMSNKVCPSCKGSRLRPESLGVTVGGKNIYEITKCLSGNAGIF